MQWQVEGVWRGANGNIQEVRSFKGDKAHVEKVLSRLEGKGRLIRRLKIKPAAPTQSVLKAN